MYTMALRIQAELGIPVVCYLCDEYYFVKTPGGLFARWQLRLRQRKMETLMAKTTHLVTICPELLKPYQQRFGVPGTVLMTGAALVGVEKPRTDSAPKNLSYFGNIRCDRYLALAEVAGALDTINKEMGAAYRLRENQMDCIVNVIVNVTRCVWVYGDGRLSRNRRCGGDSSIYRRKSRELERQEWDAP